MKATLYKIDDLKMSNNRDVAYKRLYFNLEDGSWAATDVVPTFRNYPNWKPVIEGGIGTIIDNFFMKSKNKIDADSKIKILGKKPDQQKLL
ncbi:MAG: hypothetical protein ACREGC_00985 [Minisyncoccia bacterium]